jgi:hypothetical protein
MANNVTPFPRLPTPPQEINTVYITDLVRALENLITQLQNPQLNFPQIPSSANSHTFLQGDMFISDNGFVKIAQAGDIFSGSVSATASVGTVTVSIS